MSNDEPKDEVLKQAIDRLVSSREALSAELAQRAREIEEGHKRGRSWDETKREILGRLS